MKPVVQELRLTMRERKFVEVFRGNATEAATEAGYKPSSARKIGSRLLAKPTIRQELNRRMAQAAKNVGVERPDMATRLAGSE